MSKLPVRVNVEVIITKEKKVCLCKFIDLSDKTNFWYGFPGGGVEEGDSLEETAVKECLEEVGLLVKNVQDLKVTKLHPALFNKVERNAKYSGLLKHIFTAEYDNVDKSILGADGDAVKYEWVSVQEAMEKVKDNGDWGVQRVAALNALPAITGKTPAYYNW